MTTWILVAAIGIIVSCFAAMGFAFAFIIKSISRKRYKIAEVITLNGGQSTDIIHLDDEEKEKLLLKKAESDVKEHIINTQNLVDTNVKVAASAISKVCDAGSPTVYYINVIVYIESNNTTNVNVRYFKRFKYGVKCTEEKSECDSYSGRCKGCGSELSGRKKCKNCGMVVTEPKPEINTVEIYKIDR